MEQALEEFKEKYDFGQIISTEGIQEKLDEMKTEVEEKIEEIKEKAIQMQENLQEQKEELEQRIKQLQGD